MPFPRDVRDLALVRAHRRCCVCHEFGGRSVNVHHIVQEADGGPNTIENAICLCLRCHAEAGHFNPRHPMGTKYSPDELRAHRDQWWKHCEEHPDEPAGLFLEVGFKTVSRTAEVHRYRLIASYTNTLKEAQDGWKLEVYFPAFIPLFPDGYDRHETRIAGQPYIELKSSSSARIFPGERIEVVPRNDHFVEYEVNDTVFRRLRPDQMVMWKFYTPNAPLVEGEKAFAELQEF